MIAFSKQCAADLELSFIEDSLKGDTAGGGKYTSLCEEILLDQINESEEVILTTSCTHALEISAILLDLKEGDEVIFPSFTFTSTALAFVQHGATPIFCDIKLNDFNIDEDKLESLITNKTKAIVAVHYGGFACNLKKLVEIAKKNNIVLIEDNAHGFLASDSQGPLGSQGDMSTLSFHSTKNLSCGEGGALFINNAKFLGRAKIIAEKGTNRDAFFKGQVDKYNWLDKGSSYVLSDLNAACLYGQLLRIEEIQNKRQRIWNSYYDGLKCHLDDLGINYPKLSKNIKHPAHLFYLRFSKNSQRDDFINFMRSRFVTTPFHYLPLHNSPFMKKFFPEHIFSCENSEIVSKTIARLPIFYDLSNDEVEHIINSIKEFK